MNLENSRTYLPVAEKMCGGASHQRGINKDLRQRVKLLSVAIAAGPLVLVGCRCPPWPARIPRRAVSRRCPIQHLRGLRPVGPGRSSTGPRGSLLAQATVPCGTATGRGTVGKASPIPVRGAGSPRLPRRHRRGAGRRVRYRRVELAMVDGGEAAWPGKTVRGGAGGTSRTQ